MIYEMTVPQFVKTLKNLEAVLDKAAGFADSKRIDMEVLLNSRLAADQFNLTRQIQITCDSAKLGVARLTGKDAPVHEDKEKTLGELKTRINDVINFLNSIKHEDFVSSLERKITQPRWEGKYLMGRDYLIQHVLPNVYFHFTTAYSILRHNGVEIGKKDYLGELPYKTN